MKIVDQTIIDAKRGDCLRANIASLLELEIEQVPHFILFNNDIWNDVYYYFMLALGWKQQGYSKCSPSRRIKVVLEEIGSINGFFDACVKSKTFKGQLHSVIINIDGIVVHDPNPNKKWLGVNVIKTRQLHGWTIYRPYSKEAPHD